MSAEGQPRRVPLIRSVLVALTAAACLPLLWPGDVSFINDEPLLLASALAANASRSLASMGLAGTFGFTYGPLPTWMYQLFLLITRDPTVMVILHVVLLMGTTAGALWWVSRSLGLWPWFALIPLLSPYTWFYARVLWDNTLLLPLTALALGGYAAHLSADWRRSRGALRVSVAAMLLMPLVHLMSLALVVPLALHMASTQWRALWADRIAVTIIVAIVAVVAWPYWWYLATDRPSVSEAGATSEGWLFPLLGGRLLSARELTYLFGAAPVDGRIFDGIAAISWTAFGLVWIGLGFSILSVVAAIRDRRWSPRSHLSVVLLGAVLCQMVIDGLSGKFQHPHYENGTWMVFVLLAWFAVDWLQRRGALLRAVATVATAALGCALLLSVIVIASRLHRNGGTRDAYGATLANQWRIAHELGAYTAETPVVSDVLLMTEYPHALLTLRELAGRPSGARRAGSVVIRYAYPRPESGVIMLEERR